MKRGGGRDGEGDSARREARRMAYLRLREEQVERAGLGHALDVGVVHGQAPCRGPCLQKPPPDSAEVPPWLLLPGGGRGHAPLEGRHERGDQLGDLPVGEHQPRKMRGRLVPVFGERRDDLLR